MTKHIMVFNDTQEIQELFNLILSDEGYRVTVHSYGTQDLEIVRRLKPDLLIADCPPLEREIQGWQLIQKLRMSRDTQALPIVICSTSLNLIRDNQGWLTSKKILALPKPFTADELIEQVRLQIGKANSPGLGPMASISDVTSSEDNQAQTGAEDQSE